LQEFLPSIPTNPSLSNISEAKQALLAKYLRGEVKQQPSSPRRISPRLPGSPLQLSFAQERIWFLDQLNSNSAVFNVPLNVQLSGAIDTDALRRSVNEIIRRHDVLRTTFRNVDGRPELVVASELNVELPVIDLTSYPESHRTEQARRLLSDEEQRPFDLTRGPLIRAKLFRLAEQNYRFLVNMHHIVSDGWSLVLLFQELSAIYDAFSRGEQSPLAKVSVQYADYAAWQREWLQGETLQQQLSYWKRQLGGDLPPLELSTDRPRPAVQTFNGAREWLSLPEELTDSVLALSQREGATLFMTLLTAFKVLLHRYCGQEDLIVGSPIANRPQTETESLIGFFLNNLALRTDLSGDPSFREALARVRKTALEAYANQDVPFEKLIDALKPERDLSRTPIFQVYFNLFNFGAEIRLPGSDETVSFVEAWAESDEELSKFDLTLYAGLQGRELRLALVYNTDLFDASTVALMLAHFRILLEAAVTAPQKRISALPLRRETEVDEGLLRSHRVRPGNTFIEFRKEEIEQSIADRFATQVRNYPNRVAVKSRNHEWSYSELDAVVNRITQSILRLHGDHEERIALLFEHDAPMVAGMLGTLKAGKTYVPLDPHHPEERLRQIIEHSQANALLTNNRNLFLAKKLTKYGLRLINIDAASSTALPLQTPVELPVIEPSRLAYILYTSGSTGQPKGVMQSHRNVLHHIRAYTNNLHLNADDRLSLFSSYCFDASVMDIYGALLNGATLYPIDLKEGGLAGLPEQLIDEEITVYHSTPTVYRYLLNELEVADKKSEFPKIRLVVLGGEKVNRADVELYQQNFSADCLFVNGFGPTEATVSLQNFIDKQTEIIGDSVPVGFPVADTEVLLLNKAGKPAEISGEIAIKSEHVALGYWRNTDATTAAFNSSPTASDRGSSPTVRQGVTRIYRTGDMGRRLPDGRIKFEGRKDFQIKIRGFRVELGEIESALVRSPHVRDGVVVAQENGAGDTKLVAYIVPRQSLSEPGAVATGSLSEPGAVATGSHMRPKNDPGATLPESIEATASITTELREFLKQRLPEYMVPTSFVVLDSLPLTSSGKLNRRALPAPEKFDTQTIPGQSTTAPQTPLEKLLATIWSELLEVKAIGVNENFFELGGHSLLAVRPLRANRKETWQAFTAGNSFSSANNCAARYHYRETPAGGFDLGVVFPRRH
jgi:amino acid adenylation domain-containing protein